MCFLSAATRRVHGHVLTQVLVHGRRGAAQVVSLLRHRVYGTSSRRHRVPQQRRVYDASLRQRRVLRRRRWRRRNRTAGAFPCGGEPWRQRAAGDDKEARRHDDPRARRHGTTRLMACSAMPGLRPQYGDTIWHGTAVPPCLVVPCRGVPCHGVPVSCRARAARLAFYASAIGYSFGFMIGRQVLIIMSLVDKRHRR